MRIFLILTAVLAAVTVSATAWQEPADDESIAFARANPVWTVVEIAGSQRWDATWTLRGDGKTFDAQWKHSPGGDTGELHAFATIASVRGRSVVVQRPGLGRYTGTLSADGRRITGTMSWVGGGRWEVRLEPGSLPGAPPVSVAAQKWRVIESAGSQRWTAEWTVRSDGRSLDASWVHTPGGDKGHLVNFARIRSISGRQIVIDRSGLGAYTGTISADRRAIQGQMSWSPGGTWQATLPAPLPAILP